MVFPVVLFTLGAAAVFYGARRRLPRRARAVATAGGSSVSYQHLQLYQGGLISRDALNTAKAELEQKFASGGINAVETSLRAGLEYVVKVRALTEIGTDEALRVLERQLNRRISEDPIEQSWYWIDLVRALRGLNHGESLPALLRCSQKALATPLGHLFAAEVTAFPTFHETLNDPLDPAGQVSLRILRSALEGMRRGFVPVSLYADVQMGELLRRLAESCPDLADPLLARVFIEALRHARRSYSSSPELRDDPMRRQAVRWQVSHLRDAEPILREYLHDISNDMAEILPRCGAQEQADILWVIAELHADVGAVVTDLLASKDFHARVPAIRCLQWCRHPEGGWMLCELARQAFDNTANRASWWKREKKDDDAPNEELLAVLQALRGHPGEQAEAILRECARHPQAAIRIAALKSLGWWEPIDRSAVINAMHAARIDSRADVRAAAVAGLARLGECAALQVIREALANTNVEVVHQHIDLVAAEGLTWLWPDLDLMTESDIPAVAHHAWEAIEDLRESIMGPLG